MIVYVIRRTAVRWKEARRPRTANSTFGEYNHRQGQCGWLSIKDKRAGRRNRHSHLGTRQTDKQTIRHTVLRAMQASHVSSKETSFDEILDLTHSCRFFLNLIILYTGTKQMRRE